MSRIADAELSLHFGRLSGDMAYKLNALLAILTVVTGSPRIDGGCLRACRAGIEERECQMTKGHQADRH
jgi:hypothetical protein